MHHADTSSRWSSCNCYAGTYAATNAFLQACVHLRAAAPPVMLLFDALLLLLLLLSYLSWP
jgi:hypothetical protein